MVLLLLGLMGGCSSHEPSTVIVATSWPQEDREAFETLLRSEPDSPRMIRWIVLESGESAVSAVDRRDGVDLVLGVPSWQMARLARLGRLVPNGPDEPIPWRSVAFRKPANQPRLERDDPRSDPFTFVEARARLLAEGWPQGYESLIRNRPARPSEPSPTAGSVALESLALIHQGPNRERASRLVAILEARGIARRAEPDALTRARADELLADLLGASLVDASRERRAALLALERHGHPLRAENSIGERPPWPPASVLKLRESPEGQALLETLLEQVAPDRDSRDWLRESWSKPRKPIDGDVLREIASAVEGRLVQEPRFRTWLRVEWTAWTRQLYRRVARLAGGYVPS